MKFLAFRGRSILCLRFHGILNRSDVNILFSKFYTRLPTRDQKNFHRIDDYRWKHVTSMLRELYTFFLKIYRMVYLRWILWILWIIHLSFAEVLIGEKRLNLTWNFYNEIKIGIPFKNRNLSTRYYLSI